MSAKALFETRRQKRRLSQGDEVAEVASLIGVELMPWQRRVLDVGLEHRKGPGGSQGRYFHHDVVVSCSRQQGKSVMLAMLAAWWCMSKDDQHVMFLAQTRMAAASRMSSLGRMLTRAGVEGVKWYRGVGNEHLLFEETGSRITIESPTIHGSHGESFDLVVLDEAFSYQEHVLQGVLPTQVAKPLSQMWMTSTMGLEDSDVWNRYVNLGRESVADRSSLVAYTEYAADIDAGDDVFNPDHWERWMPALGITVEADNILPSLQAMSPGEAMRAYGNVVTLTDSDLFGAGWWERSFDGYAVRPETGIVFAFDVNYEPAGASVAACWRSGERWHVELVERQAGESGLWVLDRMRGLVASGYPVAVATAGGGPARSVAEQVKVECESWAIPFRSLSVQDLAASHQLFYDSLRTEVLTHCDSEAMGVAAARVRVKDVADLWRFDRKETRVDVSPLFAAAAALFVANDMDARFAEYVIY